MKTHRKCDTCGKKFDGAGSKKNLENHMKTHDQKVKDHTCDICGESFQFKSYLEKHYINCQKKDKVRKNLKF